MVMLQAETRAKASGIECMGVQRLTGGSERPQDGNEVHEGMRCMPSNRPAACLEQRGRWRGRDKVRRGARKRGRTDALGLACLAETPRPAHENMSREHESQCKIRQPRALETKLAGTVTVITIFF